MAPNSSNNQQGKCVIKCPCFSTDFPCSIQSPIIAVMIAKLALCDHVAMLQCCNTYVNIQHQAVTNFLQKQGKPWIFAFKPCSAKYNSHSHQSLARLQWNSPLKYLYSQYNCVHKVLMLNSNIDFICYLGLEGLS